MDLMRLADILIEKIKRDYVDDVALVQVYGSYPKNAHTRSDLDIFFVPETERGYNLNFTFIFNGIGIDFFAIPWDRLEKIAAHEERIESVITEGKTLYCRSDREGKRFEQIKETALKQKDRRTAVDEAQRVLDGSYKDAFLLQNAETIAEARAYAIQLLKNICYATARLNQAVIKRGRKWMKEEISALPLVPDLFEELFDAVFFGKELHAVKNAGAVLMQKTAHLVAVEEAQIHSTGMFSEKAVGWYEEGIQFYNKIYHACETGDAYTALFACAEHTAELRQLFKESDLAVDLPDITAFYDSADLGKLADAAHDQQAAFESFLHENGIKPLRFSSFEEVESFLKDK